MRSGIGSLAAVLLVVAALAALPGLALGQEFLSYPQFRYTGGLPGNGFGVTADGTAGFKGAMSQCIPLGYTPGHGSYAFALNDGTIKGHDGICIGTGEGANGNFFAAYGFNIGKHAICPSYDAVDGDLNPAYNLQVQVANETKTRPGISVGVLDIMNWRESTRGVPPGDAGARSFYAAATKRFGADKHPVYATVGVGSNRFRGGFGGLSYDVTRRVKVLAEYDAFAFNAGVAADLTGGKRNSVVLFMGAASLNRPVVGLSVAH